MGFWILDSEFGPNGHSTPLHSAHYVRVVTHAGASSWRAPRDRSISQLRRVVASGWWMVEVD